MTSDPARYRSLCMFSAILPYPTPVFEPSARLSHCRCYHSKRAAPPHRYCYVGRSLRSASHHFHPQERVRAYWLGGALPPCVRTQLPGHLPSSLMPLLLGIRSTAFSSRYTLSGAWMTLVGAIRVLWSEKEGTRRLSSKTMKNSINR